jgi:transposase
LLTACLKVFLPPYSPDLDPIEQLFAKLKTLLRKAAEQTVDAIWRRIGALLQAFSAAECANYLPTPDMLQNRAAML